jgi:hypothetical protein
MTEPTVVCGAGTAAVTGAATTGLGVTTGFDVTTAGTGFDTDTGCGCAQFGTMTVAIFE